jgi:hypothetical protein
MPARCGVYVEREIHLMGSKKCGVWTVVYLGILFRGGGGLTHSDENREQREWGSGGSSPLVRVSAQFAND